MLNNPLAVSNTVSCGHVALARVVFGYGHAHAREQLRARACVRVYYRFDINNKPSERRVFAHSVKPGFGFTEGENGVGNIQKPPPRSNTLLRVHPFRYIYYICKLACAPRCMMKCVWCGTPGADGKDGSYVNTIHHTHVLCRHAILIHTLREQAPKRARARAHTRNL